MQTISPGVQIQIKIMDAVLYLLILILSIEFLSESKCVLLASWIRLKIQDRI